MITYELPSNIENKQYVDVTFVNKDNKVYIKTVNVPRLEDGSVNEDLFLEIIQSQISGINNKLLIGSIQFYVRPSPNSSEDIPETVRDTTR